MTQVRWGLWILGFGVVVVFVSLFADALGLGGETGFGWKQTLGLLVGVAIMVVGVLKRKS